MGSSRGGKEKKKELSDHVLKLRQRLQEALFLGIRLFDRKDKRWDCVDAETQWYALRTMVAFVECMSSAPLQHPVIKESVADMLISLEGILQSENERILSLAIEVVMKMASSLGSSIRQFHMIVLVFPLSRLLSLPHSSVTLSSLIALNYILNNLGCVRSEAYVEVWRTLGNANTVGIISLAIQNYAAGISSSEYFIQIASLLKAILWKWPPCRFIVWSDSTLMANLGDRFSDPDSSVIIGVLQLWSALALCGNGALKLVENEGLLSKILWALESSWAYDIRVEALKLCQNLSISQEGCSNLTNKHCDTIVQGIVAALSEWRSSGARKVSPDQMILVKEACQSALMTRWSGLHHSYFWKLEIDRILLDVLIDDTSIVFENQIAFKPDDIIAKISRSSIEIRPYIWNILGWLAAHCAEGFLPNKGKFRCLDALINITCSVASQFWYKGKACLYSNLCEVETVSKAVLQLVFSPSKYISLHARTCLSEVVRTFGEEYLEKLLTSLMLIFNGAVSPVSYSLHTLMNLIILACFSTLPLYQQFIVKKNGIELLAGIVRRCLESQVHVDRSCIASNLHGTSDGKLCCWCKIEDWEGGDLILFHSLQILSRLIPSSNFICDNGKTVRRNLITSNISGDLVGSLLKILSSLLDNSSSPGIRWYTHYVLSFFGLYGFPSKLGRRMAVALAENEHTNLQFVLSDGKCFRVHTAILVACCPYLLPPKDSFMKKNMFDDGSLKENRHQGTDFIYEVKLSERVDSSAFEKILEFLYAGFITIEDEEVKPLRILAKCCGLNSLSYMLNWKLPEWGSSVLTCDFSHMLEPTEHHLTDVVLEANKVAEIAWSCPMCVFTSPHIHAHKIILYFNCRYLRALFQSGMSESCSEIVKVPVGIKALTKLVKWFYSGNLPRINLDCYWNNMATIQQMHELQAYLELSTLAKFWLLEEVGEESLDMIISCLEQNHRLSMAIINSALDLHIPRIVEAAVVNVAPLYPKMRDSGELENFTEEAVDLLRSEYVRHTQMGSTRDDD